MHNMKKLKTTHSIQPPSSLPLLLLAVFALFFLSSCTTLKKSDCVEGNWSGIGFNDATAGLKSASQFRAHAKACSKHKITPNIAIYNSGYQKGLVQFCTATNGYRRGVGQSEYYGTCPQALQDNFIKGYLAGLDTATIELTEDILDLRHERRRAIRKHHKAELHKEPDAKNIKKWVASIDRLKSRIDSHRSKRRQLRRWHDLWATKR